MNTKSKFYFAAFALILPQIAPARGAEPTETGKCSQKIQRAVLEGLPQYGGHIYHAPLEQPRSTEPSPLTADPELVILPIFTISDSRGTQKLSWSDTMEKPRSNSLVAGTGVSEFTLKKFKIAVPTILFIPIGLKISW